VSRGTRETGAGGGSKAIRLICAGRYTSPESWGKRGGGSFYGKIGWDYEVKV